MAAKRKLTWDKAASVGKRFITVRPTVDHGAYPNPTPLPTKQPLPGSRSGGARYISQKLTISPTANRTSSLSGIAATYIQAAWFAIRSSTQARDPETLLRIDSPRNACQRASRRRRTRVLGSFSFSSETARTTISPFVHSSPEWQGEWIAETGFRKHDFCLPEAVDQ